MATLALLAAPGLPAATAGAQAAGEPAPEPAVALATQVGLASFYGPGLEGARTASGEPLDASRLVAAHPRWPFGTLVRVTNLANDRRVVVRVVDRGPARGPRAEGVVIDVSTAAARTLGFVDQGRARVRLEVVRWGPRGGPGTRD